MTKQYLHELHARDPDWICSLAVKRLSKLLEHSTINLVQKLTGISRTTLYRWLDEDVALDKMNYRDAAWFILYCETSPRVKMLLERPPLSHPRLARKLLEETTNGD